VSRLNPLLPSLLGVAWILPPTALRCLWLLAVLAFQRSCPVGVLQAASTGRAWEARARIGRSIPTQMLPPIRSQSRRTLTARSPTKWQVAPRGAEHSLNCPFSSRNPLHACACSEKEFPFQRVTRQLSCVIAGSSRQQPGHAQQGQKRDTESGLDRVEQRLMKTSTVCENSCYPLRQR
jgi:hypothetical protein